MHREGFSLLFYGFGSKKALLESFARECLTDGGVVVFNGYMHSMNIREILLKVASLLRVPRYHAHPRARPSSRMSMSGTDHAAPDAQHAVSSCSELARCQCTGIT